MARIYIEDKENNFLYLNLADPALAADVVQAINGASDGIARIERGLSREEIEELPIRRRVFGAG